MKTWQKLALTALALAALAGLGARSYQARQAERQALLATTKPPLMALTPADLAIAQVRDLDTGLPLTGTLKAVNSAIVKARVPGELQGLSVREGDSVRAGQVLARVEPTEYAERVRQMRLQADAAQAQVDIAQRQYDNNVALMDKGFISKTALDNSLASLNSAQANYRAAQAGAEVVRQSLSDTVLKAPIDGQIAQRLAQPGERVSPEARIVEIVDLSRLELEAALAPADSVAVRVGQHALLDIEGVAQPVQATVARINPSAQAGSRSVLVYLNVATQPGLRQGLFAHGQLRMASERALAVPLNAVRTDKPAPYVQVVDTAKGTIEHLPVQTGARGKAHDTAQSAPQGAAHSVPQDETWVAVQGVPEGAWVLRGTAGVLRAGTPVNVEAIKASSTAPSSAAASAASSMHPS
ncbi:efflux RND transporter periplasmic adaptor subunit [Ottowia sp.]|uniref:efflux RND transporter periplasmic adaptor subunit n=1 Tax=Ottowia sp. TaxID=1898956 RepID=UPI003A8BF19E